MMSSTAEVVVDGVDPLVMQIQGDAVIPKKGEDFQQVGDWTCPGMSPALDRTICSTASTIGEQSPPLGILAATGSPMGRPNRWPPRVRHGLRRSAEEYEISSGSVPVWRT